MVQVHLHAPMEMYYIYILKSLKNGRFYFGVTNNITRRLNEHNKGYSKSTKYSRPYELIYSETYQNISDAYKREKYFKRVKKISFIKKIIESNG